MKTKTNSLNCHLKWLAGWTETISDHKIPECCKSALFFTELIHQLPDNFGVEIVLKPTTKKQK